MAQGSFVITAQNKIKEGLDSAKRDLDSFEGAAKQVGDTLKAAFATTAVLASLKKLGEAAYDSYKEFGEMDRRMQQLKIALDGNEASFKRSIGLIDEMARQTLASKAEIEGLVGKLAVLGKSDADIDKITRAAVNLSNVTGEGLNESFKKVNATWAGTAGELAQLIPELGGFTKEQYAAGAAADAINKKFGDLSATLAADNIPQKLKNLETSFETLKQSFGKAIAPTFTPLLEAITSVIDRWNLAMKAADAYNRVQGAVGFSQKISAYEDIIAAREPEVNRLENWTARYLKSVNGNMSYAMRDQGFATKWAELEEYRREIAWVKAKIQDAKDEWEKTPRTLLLPGDIIDTNGRTTTTGGAPLPATSPTGVGAGGKKILSDAELIAAFMPMSSGPMSAGGYAFGRQFYEQFEKISTITEAAISDIPTAADDFLLLQNSLRRSSEAVDLFSLSIQEALASNLAPGKSFLEELSVAFAGNVDAIGGINGATSGLITGADGAIDRYTSDLSDIMAGAIDAEFVQPVSKAVEEFKGNLLQFEESFLFNLRPETFSEELSRAYAGGVDAIGATAGAFSGALTGATLDLEVYSDALSDAFAVATDAIEGVFVPGVVKAVKELKTNLLTFEESFLVNFDPRNQAQVLGDIYAASGVDMVGGGTGATVSGGGGLSEAVQSGVSTFAIAMSRVKDWMQQYGIVGKYNAEGKLEGGTQLGNLISGRTTFDAVFQTMAGDLSAFGVGLENVQASLNPLSTVLSGFVNVMGPATNAALEPFVNVMQEMGGAIGASLLPVVDALAPSIAVVAQIFQTAFAPALKILSPAIQVISLIFQTMAPVLGIVAKAFTILMSPVQYIADLFSWLGEVIQTFAWNITHWLDQKEGPGAFTSDAFTGLQGRLDAIDAAMTNSQSLQNGYNPSAQTASQSASYRVQSITINNYFNGAVVGSGGIDEVSDMIYTKFQERAYFAATA